MPFRNFSAGEVLTEDHVDTYLMRQTVMTFASASARDTALSGVLDEGMTVYLEDTNRTTKYDGSAWVVTESPWASYTPSLSNATLGNGTLNFFYRYVGWKSVHVRGTFTLGSTSAVSGLLGFGYPDSTSADTNPRSIGHAWMFDDSGSDFIGSCQTVSSIAVYGPGIVATSSTSPFTWATGDSVSIDVIFEIA